MDFAKHMLCWVWGGKGRLGRGTCLNKALREAPPPRPAQLPPRQASAAMNGSFMPWTRARSGPAAPSPALGS